MPSMNKGIEFETFGSGPLPNNGRYTLYVNDDGTVRLVDDGGNETILGTSSSSSGGVTTADVTAALEVGAIEAGDVVVEGTDLQGFVEQLLLSTFFPTFTSPSFDLRRTSGDTGNNYEVGELISFTLFADFDRGSINGDNVGGVWNPSTFQDFRAGAATNYTIEGNVLGATNTLAVVNYQVEEGTGSNNQWSASVDYAIGPQPLDSEGNNYLTPLPAGSDSDTTSVNGRRKAFYGSDSGSSTPYTTSAQIRALSDDLLNPSDGSTFTINIPIGAQMVVFAYPSSLQDVDSVIYVEGLNAEIKGVFNKTPVTVEGANGHDPTDYKVYTYVPASAFTATATYNVTI